MAWVHPRRFGRLLAWAAALAVLASRNARAERVTIEAEGGAAWVSRNDARIPGDSGTRFSLLDLAGRGPEPYFRVGAEYRFGDLHTLRLTAAPFEVRGAGRLAGPVRFEGAEFAPDEPVEGLYRFDTYRLTYRRRLGASEAWRWGAGAAILVRDAEIRLRQGARSESSTDTGFVPLLHARVERRIGRRTSAVLDAEGLVGPGGRALDLALRLAHEPVPGLAIALGYRTLEGGADNDRVYTFAWLHFATLWAAYRF